MSTRYFYEDSREGIRQNPLVAQHLDDRTLEKMSGQQGSNHTSACGPAPAHQHHHQPLQTRCFFRFKYEESANVTVKLVGSVPQLGAWDIEKAVELVTTPDYFPCWISQDPVLLPLGEMIEYQYVVETRHAATRDGHPRHGDCSADITTSAPSAGSRAQGFFGALFHTFFGGGGGPPESETAEGAPATSVRWLEERYELQPTGTEMTIEDDEGWFRNFSASKAGPVVKRSDSVGMHMSLSGNGLPTVRSGAAAFGRGMNGCPHSAVFGGSFGGKGGALDGPARGSYQFVRMPPLPVADAPQGGALAVACQEGFGVTSCEPMGNRGSTTGVEGANSNPAAGMGMGIAGNIAGKAMNKHSSSLTEVGIGLLNREHRSNMGGPHHQAHDFRSNPSDDHHPTCRLSSSDRGSPLVPEDVDACAGDLAAEAEDAFDVNEDLMHHPLQQGHNYNNPHGHAAHSHGHHQYCDDPILQKLKEDAQEQELPPHASVCVVAFQLPLKLTRTKDGTWAVTESKANLIPSLHNTARSGRAGFRPMFVGWPGVYCDGEYEKRHLSDMLMQYDCVPVFIPREEFENYMHFCQLLLWPILHEVLRLNHGGGTEHGTWNQSSPSRPSPPFQELWASYQRINSCFSDVICRSCHAADSFWIQDYHLLTLPQYLTRRIRKANIGLFLHTPFPSSDIFRCLAVREEILRAMLCCDMIGFQFFEYVRNFSANGQMGIEYGGRAVMVRVAHVMVNVAEVHEAASKLGELKAALLADEEKQALAVNRGEIQQSSAGTVLDVRCASGEGKGNGKPCSEGNDNQVDEQDHQEQVVVRQQMSQLGSSRASVEYEADYSPTASKRSSHHSSDRSSIPSLDGLGGGSSLCALGRKSLPKIVEGSSLASPSVSSPQPLKRAQTVAASSSAAHNSEHSETNASSPSPDLSSGSPEDHHALTPPKTKGSRHQFPYLHQQNPYNLVTSSSHCDVRNIPVYTCPARAQAVLNKNSQLQQLGRSQSLATFRRLPLLSELASNKK
eukprot:g15342.t1